RVAEGGVLDPAAGADLTDDNRARRRTDAHAEALDAPAAQDLLRVVLHLADDAQGGEHGPLGIVFTRHRRAEEGEHAVAREILHVAAERLDLADDARDRLAYNELHIFWIESLRERCRADDVDEQRRDDLALLAYTGGHTVR